MYLNVVNVLNFKDKIMCGLLKIMCRYIIFPSIIGVLYVFPIIIWDGALLEVDYKLHAEFAVDMYVAQQITIPHFLHQFILLAISKIFSLDIKLATYIAVFCYVFSTAFILIYYFQAKLKQTSSFIICCAVVIIMFSNPIAITFFQNNFMYLGGYIYINVYHNPTILLLKPIALISFFLIIELLSSNSLRINHRVWAVCLCFTLLSIVAKPNYIIVLLPSLLLLLVCHNFSRQYNTRNWNFIIFSIVISSVLLLAMQFLITYSAASGNGIGIGLFMFQTYYVAEWTIPFSFIASVVFPLSLLFFVQLARLSLSYQLSLILIIMGIIYSYFFYETGERLLHGNFGWSGIIANFLFFCVSVQLFINATYNWTILRVRDKEQGIRLIIISGCLLLLFFISGVFYYIRILITGSFL